MQQLYGLEPATPVSPSYSLIKRRHMLGACQPNGGRAHTSKNTGNCHPVSQSVDTAGWQAKMASIELWIQ